MKVVTAAQMAELDRLATEQYGIPPVVLMENAGRSCADRILGLLEEKAGAPEESSVAIVCGKGRNAGDGFVVARHLHNRGVYVEVFLLFDERELTPPARAQYEIVRKHDIECRPIRDKEGVEDLRFFLEETHICVDAIFGTGLSKAPTGIIKDVVETMNVSMSPVYAIDIPSGIDSTTGRQMGEAVRADYTGTFGLLKVGHVLLPGSVHCGETDVFDIGLPSRAVFDSGVRIEALDEKMVRSNFSVRPPGFHKGNAGRLMVVGGSPGLTGAPVLAAKAAIRAGAGLVTVVVPESLHGIVEAKLLEAMSAGVPDGGLARFEAASVPALLDRVSKADLLIVGPGLGNHPGAGDFLEALIPSIRVPFILDADGLSALAGRVSVLRKAQSPVIVTPHPGEMSRLTGESVEAIEASRLGVAASFAEEQNVTVVLKGARTVIATPRGDLFINTTGNPYMASGGMGDVLSGFVGALAAQGMSPSEASCAGVFLHGLSADLIVRRRPMAAVTASDVIENFPEAIRYALGDPNPPEEG